MTALRETHIENLAVTAILRLDRPRRAIIDVDVKDHFWPIVSPVKAGTERMLRCIRDQLRNYFAVSRLCASEHYKRYRTQSVTPSPSAYSGMVPLTSW